MGQKPRRAPQDIPDSLPKREGTDVQPDAVRRTEEPQTVPPDSLPESEDEASPDSGLAEEIVKVDSAVRS
jgi:hypothetical protein